jgi:paraquat-inducible protein A
MLWSMGQIRTTAPPLAARPPSMSLDDATVVLCPDCDALQTLESTTGVPPSRGARCFRCGARVWRGPGPLPGGAGIAAALVLVVTALPVFVAAITLPILRIEGAGDVVTVSVWQAAEAFQAQRLPALAALVAVTTAGLPALELGCLVVLLGCAVLSRGVRSASRVARWLELIRPWSDLEILCLGLVVAARKLTSGYQVHLGPGLACLVFVLGLELVVNHLVDPASLWSAITARAPGARLGGGTS